MSAFGVFSGPSVAGVSSIAGVFSVAGIVAGVYSVISNALQH